MEWERFGANLSDLLHQALSPSLMEFKASAVVSEMRGGFHVMLDFPGHNVSYLLDYNQASMIANDPQSFVAQAAMAAARDARVDLQ